MRKIWVFLALLGASPLQAQPQTNAAPMTPGAANLAPGGPDWTKMTPDERRDAIRKTIEGTVRAAMTHLGHDDKATQDAVVATALAEEDSLAPVRDAHRKLALSLVMNPKADKESAILLADLRDAIKDARTERENLIKDLEARIEFSKKPGLNAFLSLLGITGDESAFMGGIPTSFLGARANMTRQLG